LTAPVAFVLKGYPRLSETFIAQEICELERRGLEIRIVSLRHPTDPDVHPVHRRIRAPVRYLPEYLYQEPLRVLRAWWTVRRWPRYRQLVRLWLRDLWRDRTPNRVRRFGQALVLARELEPDVRWLHAHFLHTPGSVARYVAVLRDLDWSVSAHARDIWTTPDWEKREKLAAADWAVTCSRAAYADLAALAPSGNAGGRVELVYHGLDLDCFAAEPRPPTRRDGGDAAAPVELLSVGRAVAKKGYDDLLDALALLPAELHWRLRHIGGGPLLDQLRQQAQRLGIADRIDWAGARSQADVLAAYRAADLFVLASRIAADGDRDGLPNVLLEAQSQGLACVASNVSAIPELIEPDVTGLLAPPRDPAALSAAINALAVDPARRERLGRAGQHQVHSRFSLPVCIDPLAERFGLAVTTNSTRASA